MDKGKVALIVSVGGSIDPVINVILEEEEEVDFIVFVTSDTGDPKTSTYLWVEDKISSKAIGEWKGKGDNIISICRWEKGYQILKVHPDDFNSIHQIIFSEIQRLRKEGFERFLVDFTAGTKMMSSACVVVGMITPGAELFFSKGVRTDTRQIFSSYVTKINVDDALVCLLLEKLSVLWSRWQYASVYKQIKDFLNKQQISQQNFSRLAVLADIAQSFSYWDQFRFAESMNCLTRCKCGNLEQYIRVISKLSVKSRWQNADYFIGELMENAYRRKELGEYDNAAARLYRVLELFAQAILRRYGLDSSRICVEKLYELGVSAHYIQELINKKGQDNDIKLGLIEDYELLCNLSKTAEVMKNVYLPQKDYMLNKLLKNRNHSILAHGLEPLYKDIVEEFFDFCERFINDISEKLPEDLKIIPKRFGLPKSFVEFLD